MNDPLALATARHRLYGLLGQLVADGLTAELRPVVQSLPALAPLAKAPPQELAVEHTRWFTHELSPHASAFVDGTLNGPTTAQTRATWTAAGFAHGRTDLEDDHLALFLAALSFLCAAELEARQDGIDPEPILSLQGRVVGELQAWLPLLTDAVHGPWAQATELLQELVDDHGSAPEVPELQLDAVTARDLLVPTRCGWVCTFTALERLAEASGCAVGFGSKRRSLRALLDAEAGRRALAQELSRPGSPSWQPRREAVAAALRAE